MGLLGLTVCAALGQRAFDVASIRPSEQAGRGRGGHGMGEAFGGNVRVTPDSVILRGVSLRTCIAWAYHVQESLVTGPDWMGDARFDIVAKAAAPADEDHLRAMMQALLADRFKVAAHRQTKEMQVYVLEPGKSGAKVHASESQGEASIQPDPRTMTVTVQRAGVSQLTDLLSRALRAPVLDQTGLAGKYDLTVNVAKYLADRQTGGQPLDPISLIEEVLREELGLKLDSRKLPVDLVVVDRAEKTPTEN
ncbi:MAG: TIGR03435 family protein [Acidobacteria bacterium]|nr:TIGR03435 family protein [Acidobacteriota bacterium]